MGACCIAAAATPNSGGACDFDNSAATMGIAQLEVDRQGGGKRSGGQRHSVVRAAGGGSAWLLLLVPPVGALDSFGWHTLRWERGVSSRNGNSVLLSLRMGEGDGSLQLRNLSIACTLLLGLLGILSTTRLCEDCITHRLGFFGSSSCSKGAELYQLGARGRVIVRVG
jgi:hypothetical protein